MSPQWLQIAYFGAFYCLLRATGVPRGIWLWIGGATGLNALLASVQYVKTGERMTAAGLIGDIGTGGVVFGLVTLMLLREITGNPGKSRAIGALLAVVNFAGLVFCASLTSLAAFCVGLLVWMALSLYENPRGHWHWQAFFLIVLSAMTFVNYSGLPGRVERMMAGFREGIPEAVTSDRNIVTRASLQMIGESPVFGRGLGSFGRELFNHRMHQPPGRNPEYGWNLAHNEYLQAWIELGLLGFVLTIVLLLWPPIGAIVRHGGKLASPAAAGIFFAICAAGFFPLHLAVTAAYGAVVMAECGEWRDDESL